MKLKDKLQTIIPATFFAGRKTAFRVRKIVELWQRVGRAFYILQEQNEVLKLEIECLTEENDRLKAENARALAMLP